MLCLVIAHKYAQHDYKILVQAQASFRQECSQYQALYPIITIIHRV